MLIGNLELGTTDNIELDRPGWCDSALSNFLHITAGNGPLNYMPDVRQA